MVIENTNPTGNSRRQELTLPAQTDRLFTNWWYSIHIGLPGDTLKGEHEA